MPGLKSTGRMRKAIMDQMGLIRTRRHGQWKLIPVPPHPNRSILYNQDMIDAMDNTGHSPETLALWEPLNEAAKLIDWGSVGLVLSHLNTWNDILKLVWTPDLLPSCKGCEFSNFNCTKRPPYFQCRVLTMSKRMSLRPNVYWKRLIDLG